MTILFVSIWSFIVGVGLSYLMLGGIIQAERRRRDGYPSIRNEQPPIPICHPDRHSALTGAYQEQMAMDERLVAELTSEIDELESDAHEYRQEIQRLRDELAAARQPAPVAASRYNVIDRFAYLEVAE